MTPQNFTLFKEKALPNWQGFFFEREKSWGHRPQTP
jgi:hypothetical protein